MGTPGETLGLLPNFLSQAPGPEDTRATPQTGGVGAWGAGKAGSSEKPDKGDSSGGGGGNARRRLIGRGVDVGASGDPAGVTVVGNGSSVTLSQNRVQTGSIAFRTSTTNPSQGGNGGSSISLFRPKFGKTLGNFFADLGEEFSQKPAVAAKGTRHLVGAVTIYGLSDLTVGSPRWSPSASTLAPTT